MNYQQTRAYLLGKPEAYEDFPFGPDVAVMKIDNKMFATLSGDGDTVTMNLKCDPHEAQILRDIFAAVGPGYHMNKKHWNTIVLNDSVPSGELQRMIDNSYALVVRNLSRARRQALEIRHGKDALYPTAT